MPTKIELNGQLISAPETRVTPAGSRTLRLQVDCGDGGNHLILDVVMAGQNTVELARELRAGERVHAVGSLRLLDNTQRYRAKAGIEVVASSITPELAGTKL